MQQQVKELDFSGQNIYVGMDVHKKQITVTILGGKYEYKTFSQDPDAGILVRYLNRNFPGARYYAAYEAGFSGFWLQESLQSQGVDCMVVHPSDVPTKDKERKQKRDPMDSRKIARSLRNGELDAIHVPSKSCQQDRTLLRARHKLVSNLTRSKNRIKALLHFFGVSYPEQFTRSGTHWSKRFIGWLKEVDLGETGNVTLGIYIEEAEFLRALVKRATVKIRGLTSQERYLNQVKLLISVPGIGTLTAMTLLSELENIGRFKNRDSLCDYVGLVPNVSASGDSEHVGEITQRGNKTLRKSLIESSWVAMRMDPALTMKYNKLCSRMTANKAIIRIARMLLSRIRYVLLNEKEYQLALVS